MKIASIGSLYLPAAEEPYAVNLWLGTGVGGKRLTVGDLQFDSLLRVVDSIKRHARIDVVPSL